MSRRSDRLFRLILLLDRRTPVTAAALAAALEVGVRTVYRDVADLVASGVPIDGAAGVGYRLTAGYRLPPLMFTAEELEALELGAEMVRGWAGSDLARAADDALRKVRHALPRDAAERQPVRRVHAAQAAAMAAVVPRVTELRRAARERRKVRFAYADAGGRASERTVRPLALFYWGGRWTLAAWCEMRGDFRDFRLDRMQEVAVTGERWTEIAGSDLETYLGRLRALLDAAGERP